MLRMVEEHQKALTHPYLFEEYMGLGHVFDEPPGYQATPARARTREAKEQAREEMRARENRIMATLEKHAVATNNAELN